ncbi:protein ZBED8-like [Centruroides sculpturatus]|uniref:protein ZBED8-like n=1 Tax=Centruroides sculpturatus TaxID=218467 RepID=UPI000C6EA196|nr:protein ZBED8-like [Centruroides sculpturatus]
MIPKLLFAKCLETDTKDETISNELKTFFNTKVIPLSNILFVTTDGATAMVGRHRGFLAYLKQAKLNILSVHCVIHRHHLVAKNLSERLHGSLDYVIRAFPNLLKLKKRDDDLHVYCQHITALHSDLSQRFEDILHLGIPNWVLDPFASRPTNSDEAILI